MSRRLKHHVKMMGRRILPLLVGGVLLLSGLGCRTASKETQERTQPLTLNWWAVFTDYSSLAQNIADYRALHPNVSVNFRKLSYDEYETALLDALAEDRGPDIISLHNSWLREWQDRLLPAPGTVRMPFTEMKGSIKKEEVTEMRDVPIVNPKGVMNNYLDVVGTDVILPLTDDLNPAAQPVSRVYGLPLSIDTLATYYNKDLLDAAGIAQPAQYWSEFQSQVKLLTQLDETGTLIQSGAALGTSENVDRAGDILSLLMMQNGTPMTDSSGSATFDRYSDETVGQPLPPGAVALVFYNDFANPLKEVYSWNADQPDALTAFVNGQVAYFFGYSYHLEQIRAANSDLNFGIAPFPQIEGNRPVNAANYWVETVSAKTKHSQEAWDLVNYVAAANSAKSYLARSKRPTALRSLVNSQLEDADLSVFASELPAAASWYRGKDGPAAEQVMLEMIDQMLEPDADPKRILEIAAVKINQTLK